MFSAQYLTYLCNTVSIGFYMHSNRYVSVIWIIVLVSVLSGCAETQFAIHSAKRIVGATTQPILPKYKIGKPYKINNIWYYPEENYNHNETGIASWYGAKFHGRKTANGEVYDMNALTAAHRTLPMPSYVRVTNLENGRSLVLRINDRGPFAHSRVVDISRRGSQLLGFQKAGTARVRVQILADKSRALKAQLTGQAQLAKVGSPITVERLPKAKVESKLLGPPTEKKLPISAATASPERLDGAENIAPKALDIRDVAEAPTTGEVEFGQVALTQIFVQAGAFHRFDNANKVRARLSSVGHVAVSSVLRGGRDLFRVRIGPFKNVGDADQVLASVTKAGFLGARIVVE